jgi:hypothetical protein
MIESFDEYTCDRARLLDRTLKLEATLAGLDKKSPGEKYYMVKPNTTRPDGRAIVLAEFDRRPMIFAIKLIQTSLACDLIEVGQSQVAQDILKQYL